MVLPMLVLAAALAQKKLILPAYYTSLTRSNVQTILTAFQSLQPGDTADHILPTLIVPVFLCQQF